MSKKINGFSPLGYSPYANRSSTVEQDALQSARVEKSAEPRAAEPVDQRKEAAASAPNDLSRAEQRMILRAFPENPDLSLRLYGPNRDAQTINPGAVGNQIDVQG